MSEKRFKIIDKQFISYYGGDGHQISDGDCKFWLWHNQEESQKVCDKLNDLLDENEQLRKDQQRLYEDNIRIKQLITEAHSNERTAIGRSVLLQIIEQL